MNGLIRVMGIVLALSGLCLAGCVSPGGYGGSSGGYGGSPGGYGQPDPGWPSQYGSRLQGTVDGVDTSYGRILLFVDDPRIGRAERVEVRYDPRTRLYYQGREHAVEGLERGDVIRVDVAQSGRDLWARSIEVVHNVRDGGYGGYGGGYQGGAGGALRGSVAYVDPRARVIRLDRGGYGGDMQLLYDGRTTVEYQRRLYRPEDLQRGDLVRIEARPLGRDEWLAERIVVERSYGY